MSWIKKAGIGAGGGLCLVLIRLYENNFYLDLAEEQMIVGYLGAATFVVVAAIFAGVYDEENPRKLLMQGLLAPSLIISLVHQGNYIEPTETSSAQDVPEIGQLQLEGMSSWLRSVTVRTVYAQEVEPGLVGSDLRQVAQVKTLKKEDISGSLLDGVWRFVGRAKPKANYLFLVAKTKDLEIANSMQQQLKAVPGIENEHIEIVQPWESEYLFLSVGGLQTAQGANQTKERLDAKVIDSLPAIENDQTRNVAYTVLKGAVVNAESLVE